jgi:hypothetical protein
MTATKDPRVRVINHGRENWRTEARDDCGEWAITGPPYPTQAEAFANVDAVVANYFGTPVDTSRAPVTLREAMASLTQIRAYAEGLCIPGHPEVKRTLLELTAGPGSLG